ncbi:MAG: LapA family protein [Nitrospiraceae bacterium]|nr:MAG: LapA family protein [Nitrospiraceae bacterium]
MTDQFRGSLGPKTIIALVFLSIFTVFILQNTEVVEIIFFFWKISLSRVILLLGSLFTGVLIGLFIGWETASRNKKR